MLPAFNVLPLLLLLYTVTSSKFGFISLHKTSMTQAKYEKLAASRQGILWRKRKTQRQQSSYCIFLHAQLCHIFCTLSGIDVSMIERMVC